MPRPKKVLDRPKPVKVAPVIKRDVKLKLKQPFAFLDLVYTIFLFVKSDFLTFTIPNTVFGLLGAIAGPILTSNPAPSIAAILYRSFLALVLNFMHTLVFNFDNQATWEGVVEDQVNKPDRPIPQGRITIALTRQLQLYCIPLTALLAWSLGSWEETGLIFMMDWMYGAAGGSEGNFLMRDLLVGMGFGLYNHHSLRIIAGAATGAEHVMTSTGTRWAYLITAVIFTTIKIQDIKDAAGDKLRGRQTCPLVLGDRVARYMFAVPVALWSVFCPWFLGLSLFNVAFWIPCVLGAVIVWRVLNLSEKNEDDNTWRTWCGWLMLLYTLPLFA